MDSTDKNCADFQLKTARGDPHILVQWSNSGVGIKEKAWIEAVKAKPSIFKSIPLHEKTVAICFAAVSAEPSLFKKVPEILKTDELEEIYQKQAGSCAAHVEAPGTEHAETAPSSDDVASRKKARTMPHPFNYYEARLCPDAVKELERRKTTSNKEDNVSAALKRFQAAFNTSTNAGATQAERDQAKRKVDQMYAKAKETGADDILEAMHNSQKMRTLEDLKIGQWRVGIYQGGRLAQKTKKWMWQLTDAVRYLIPGCDAYRDTEFGLEFVFFGENDACLDAANAFVDVFNHVVSQSNKHDMCLGFSNKYSEITYRIDQERQKMKDKDEKSEHAIILMNAEAVVEKAETELDLKLTKARKLSEKVFDNVAFEAGARMASAYAESNMKKRAIEHKA